MKQPTIKILTRCTLHPRTLRKCGVYAICFFIIITVTILCTKSPTIAADPPHSSSKSVYCNSCHSVHKASGTSLTNKTSNENLCLSCHTPTSNKPFSTADQADFTCLLPLYTDETSCETNGGTWDGTRCTLPAYKTKATCTANGGTWPPNISHRWDTAMETDCVAHPDKCGPYSNYGLRAPSGLTSTALKSRLTTYGYVVTCSICHNQHGQASTSWDPYGGPYTGKKGGDSGITTADSTPTTIIDSSKSTYWTTDCWKDYYVKMTSGENIGQIRRISGNTNNELTVSAPFPAAIAKDDGYEIIGRHFQRISDDLNQMCEDCHYYRTAGTTGTNVRTYDEGYKKSHPVVKIFSNAQGEERSAGLDGTQFNTAPLEPSYVYWGAQTGTRYNQDGAGCSNPTYTDESSCTGNGYIWAADNNVTNNIVVDSSKKTRCLSCHGIHYTDSSSGTIDGPDVANGDGYLLKRSPEETCHACHKTNVNTPSPGQPGYVEGNWNGAIKMHSAEMFGTCSNTTYKTRTACINASATWTAGEWNTSGGWGVAGGKYGEIVCTTCHTAHGTKNIYLIKETITSPNSPTENFPGGADSPVDFRSKTAGSATGTMGWEDGTTRTSSTRVCEACHTYNATDGSDGVKFHGYSVSDEEVSHQGTGTCTDCHSHKQAFSGGGCTGCHGYPPAADTAAPPDGLAWTNPTGSTVAGAHNLHYTIKSYPCTTCHKGSTGTPEPPHKNGLITLGFYIELGSTYQGGNYDGQTTPPVDGYNVTTTSPPTTITTPSTGAKTCSLYCHGSTLDATTLPIWSGTISCGSCHTALQTDVSRGSHARHARSAPNRELACTVCHAGYVATPTAHTINGSADWAYDTTTYSWLSGALYNGNPSGSKTPVPSASYDTCSNLYCHSDVQTDGGGATTYLPTPQWGGTVGCGDCHKGRKTDATTMDTGSHTKHVQSYNYSCSICHNNAGTGTTKHANYNIDVAFTSLNPSGTYNQSPNTPGYDGYVTCSTTYCHGAGEPQWGGTLVGDCTDCHGFPPPTNAHAAHIQDATLLTREYGNTEVKSNAANYVFGCGNCHPIDKTTYHANGTPDISLDPTEPGPLKSLNDATAAPSGASPAIVCNKIYCHSNGAGGAKSNLSTVVSPAWNTTFGANKCGACHDNPPQYASAGAGVAGANSHYNAAPGFMGKEGGHMLPIHRDNIYDKVSGSGLITLDDAVSTDSRHGNPAVATTMACYVCHSGVVSSTTIDTYAMNGTGSSFECSACHTAATTTKLQAGVIVDKSLHVSGSANVVFATITLNSKAQLRDSSKPLMWNRNGTYGVSGSYDSSTATLDTGKWASATKSCTVVCHNNESVTWGDTNATCYSCHKSL